MNIKTHELNAMHNPEFGYRGGEKKCCEPYCWEHFLNGV